MVVSEIMTKDPISVGPTTKVSDVVGTLLELEVRHLPVTENGQLIGIVSDRDLRSFVGPDIWALDEPEERMSRLATPVSEVMSADPATLSPESTLVEAVDCLLEEGVGAVPVVEDHESKLVGIVSYVDILRAVRPDLD